MNIADKVFVVFDYKLTLDSGEEVDSSPEGQPLAFITGSNQIIPVLEKAMMGMTGGENLKITIEPDDAYGQVNSELFKNISRSSFPVDLELKPGMIFQTTGPQGETPCKIKEIKDENTVIVDFNHPLAGERLHFDVNIVSVREPTDEELSGLSSAPNCDYSAEEQADSGTKGGCC